MGQREKFSTSDLAKINKMYKCPQIDTTTTPETTTEPSTSVTPTSEWGASTDSTTVPTERPPNNSNNYPLLEILSSLYQTWNAGK